MGAEDDDLPGGGIPKLPTLHRVKLATLHIFQS
jgi:hypothetical protein